MTKHKSHQIYATATFLNPTQRRDFFDNSWVQQASALEERDYKHLAPHKKIKKRDGFEEWLYRRYSIAGSVIPATGRFDPIASWSQPDI